MSGNTTDEKFEFLKTSLKHVTSISRLACWLVGAFGLASCQQEAQRGTPFFLRYIPPNIVEYEQYITMNQQLFEKAIASRNVDSIVYYGAQFGESLTNAQREDEAQQLIGPLVTKYAQQVRPENRGWLMLHWATANQYLHETNIAAKGFKEALSIAQLHGFRELEHYTLHHYGRFLVERSELAEAKAAFEQALQIRKSLNDKRAVNTQMALDSIAIMQQFK